MNTTLKELQDWVEPLKADGLVRPAELIEQLVREQSEQHWIDDEGRILWAMARIKELEKNLGDAVIQVMNSRLKATSLARDMTTIAERKVPLHLPLSEFAMHALASASSLDHPTTTQAQPAQQEPLKKYSDIVSDGGLDPRNDCDLFLPCPACQGEQRP